MTDLQSQDRVEIPSNRTIVCTKWGKKPKQQAREAPLTVSVKPGTVLVNVKAACLSALDVQLCRGYLKRKVAKSTPHGLGYDFSGVVTHTSTSQGKFKVGDAVFGCLPLNQPGALSDHILVDESWCALKPESLSHDTAASLGWNCLLANAALRDLHVSLDDRVLVLGGTSSTGHLLIQLAKELFEVEWVATTSTHQDRGFCEGCGADEVFDYQASKTTHWAAPFLKTHSYDVILDCVNDPLSFKLLRRGGRQRTLLTGEQPPALFSFSCKPPAELPEPDGEVLERIAVLAVLEKIRPNVVTAKFPEAAETFLTTLPRLLVIQFD